MTMPTPLRRIAIDFARESLADKLATLPAFMVRYFMGKLRNGYVIAAFRR